MEEKVAQLEAMVVALTQQSGTAPEPDPEPDPTAEAIAELEALDRGEYDAATWDPSIGHPTSYSNKQAVSTGIYAKVASDGTLRGYGARRQRPGEPGKMDDARTTFSSVEAAEAWRAEVEDA